jgi:hypothetical protein
MTTTMTLTNQRTLMFMPMLNIKPLPRRSILMTSKKVFPAKQELNVLRFSAREEDFSKR